MGSGMAQMMFPGVQHYMSRMGMGMGPTSLPSITSPVHLSRVPLVDQSMTIAQAQNQAVMCQNSMLNPVSFQNQMQNANFSDQCAHYMGFHPMQTTSQVLLCLWQICLCTNEQIICNLLPFRNLNVTLLVLYIEFSFTITFLLYVFQPINMFRFGSPTVQSQVTSPPSTSHGPFMAGAATDNTSLSGKTGT